MLSLTLTKKSATFNINIDYKKNALMDSLSIHRQFPRWLLFGIIIVIPLAILPNANDSTILKPAALYVLTASLIAAVIAKNCRQQQLEITFSAIHVLFACYILVSFISLLSAVNMSLAWESLLRLLCYFIVFAASYEFFASAESTAQLNTVFIVTISLSCIVELLQRFVFIPMNVTEVMSNRTVMSTFGNTAYFSGYLILLFPLVACQFLQSKKTSVRVLLLVLALTMAYVLVETESRSGWIALIVSGSIFILLYFKTSKWRIVMIFAILVLTVLTYFFFPDIIGRRINALFHASPTSSVMRRVVFYEGAWNAFLASPIIGNSIGNFEVFLPKFRLPSYWMTRSEDIVPHAHNEFLEILSETGILGFVFFIAIFVFLFIYISKSLRVLNEQYRLYVITFTSCIVAVLVDNLASLNLRTIPVAVCFWIVVAVLLRAVNSSSRNISFSLPIVVYRLRWLPYAGLIFFLAWYVPIVLTKSKAEKNVLDGELFRFKNMNNEAIASYQDALRYVPGHPVALFSLAATLNNVGNYREMREHANHLLADYPWYPKAHLLSAISSFELGDTNAGLDELAKEMKLANTPQTYYYAGYFAYRLRHNEEEYRMLKLLLYQNIESKISDFSTNAIDRLSEVCREQHSENECKNLLQQMRTTFPSDAQVLTSIAVCYNKLGFGQLSEETASQAIALQPDSSLTERLEQILQRTSK